MKVRPAAFRGASDPWPTNQTRHIESVEVVFGPSPLTPLPNAAAGRAGPSSSSTGGVDAKKRFDFQDRISGGSGKMRPFSTPNWVLAMSENLGVSAPPWADVAELADALDSKFYFHRFQRAASRFNEMDKTPDSNG